MGEYSGGFGGGLARGIETGVGIAKTQYDIERQSRLDARNEKQQEFENDLKIRAEDRIKDVHTRELATSALTQIGEEEKKLNTEQLGRIQAYKESYRAAHPGMAEPDDATMTAEFEKDPNYREYTNKVNDLYQQKSKVTAVLGGDFALKRFDTAQRDGQDWESGKVTPTDLPPKRFAAVLSTAAQVPPSEFLRGPNGEPSKVGEKITEIKRLMEMGQYDKALTVGRDFLPPSAHQAEGHTSIHGGEFQGADEMYPIQHPNDPDHFSLGIKGEVLHPDGSTTTGITTALDDKGNVRHYSMDQLMDTVSRISALEAAANDPKLQDHLREAVKNGADREHDTATGIFIRTGGTPAQLKSKLTHTQVKNGKEILDFTYDEEGNLVGKSTLSKEYAPPKEHDYAPSEGEKNFGLVRRVEANPEKYGYKSVDEADAALKKAGVIKSARGGGLAEDKDVRTEYRDDVKARFFKGTDMHKEGKGTAAAYHGPGGTFVKDAATRHAIDQALDEIETLKSDENPAEAAARVASAFKIPFDRKKVGLQDAASAPSSSTKDPRAVALVHAKAQAAVAAKGLDAVNKRLIEQGYPPLPQ